MYYLSKKDIAFIKRCIKHYSKNAELNEDEVDRAKWIPKSLDKNHKDEFIAHIAKGIRERFVIQAKKDTKEIF